jgi:rRNA maturation protein Nop10
VRGFFYPNPGPCGCYGVTSTTRLKGCSLSKQDKKRSYANSDNYLRFSPTDKYRRISMKEYISRIKISGADPGPCECFGATSTTRLKGSSLSRQDKKRSYANSDNYLRFSPTDKYRRISMKEYISRIKISGAVFSIGDGDNITMFPDPTD